MGIGGNRHTRAPLQVPMRKIIPYIWLIMADLPLLGVVFIALPFILLLHALIVMIAIQLKKVHIIASIGFLLIYSFYVSFYGVGYESPEWRDALFFSLFPVWSSAIMGLLLKKTPSNHGKQA